MKDGFIKIAAAAPKVRVGDCAHNAQRIIEDVQEASRIGVNLLVFPELAITGYCVSDLIFQDAMYESQMLELKRICDAVAKTDMLVFVGLAFREGGKTYNAAAALFGGRVLGIIPKTNLPTYAEFYELRTYEVAPEQNRIVQIFDATTVFGTKLLFCCEGLREFVVAAEICEDIWVGNSPSLIHAPAGAEIIVNLSASNDFVCKDIFRRDMVSMQSAKCTCCYVYTSSGDTESTQDVVFSAHRIIAQLGDVIGESKPFDQSRFAICDCDVKRIAAARYRGVSVSSTDDRGYTKIPFDMPIVDTKLEREFPPMAFVDSDPVAMDARCEHILKIQSYGLKKRVEHINAAKLLLGISGGLDSTLALMVCCRALELMGRPRTDLICVSMPCFGTTARTKSNAEKLCTTLGVDYRLIDISNAVSVHLKDIGLAEGDHSVAFENAQARERTQVLFDLANATGGFVVGTGDLSEGAMGFATYNGDQMSNYCVNCSVPKTVIPYILRYCAKNGFECVADVLADVIDTPVSPELLPVSGGVQAQRTQDTTGPYELVDFFLYYFMRWGFSPKKILRIANGAFEGKYSEDELRRWLRVFLKRFFANQFKRSACPDGPKVGSVSLSPRGDWRMPSDACADVWLAELDD